MRLRRTLLAFALLLSGCVTVGSERVHIGIWNTDALPHMIRIEIDGQSFFYGTAGVLTSEPAITASIDTHLPSGSHRIEIVCDTVARSVQFEVRPSTRSNLHIFVKRVGCDVKIVYGDLLAM